LQANRKEVDENGQLRSVVKFEEDSPPALREIFRAATEGYDDEYGPPCFFFQPTNTYGVPRLVGGWMWDDPLYSEISPLYSEIS